MTHKAYISLGGNMGGEEALFGGVLERIASWKGIAAVKASSLYRTEPQGDAAQPWFRNQVAELFCTGFSPESLLEALLALEDAFGRTRDPSRRFGPRRIDLDLLLFGSTVLSGGRLQLPHPRMAERAFVLVPLLEIAPEAALPDGRALRGILESLSYQVEGDVIRQPAPLLRSSPKVFEGG